MASLIPPGLVAVDAEADLPPLPPCHLTLRLPEAGGSPVAVELARYIQQGFAALRAAGGAG